MRMFQRRQALYTSMISHCALVAVLFAAAAVTFCAGLPVAAPTAWRGLKEGAEERWEKVKQAVEDLRKSAHQLQVEILRYTETETQKRKDSFRTRIDTRINMEPHDYWMDVLETFFESEAIDLHNSPLHRGESPSSRHLRFVSISDTHGEFAKLLEKRLPDGDVLIHAGDFTHWGSVEEIKVFNEEIARILKEYSYSYIVVVAGNHELGLDVTEGTEERKAKYRLADGTPMGHLDNYRHLTNCIQIGFTQLDTSAVNKLLAKMWPTGAKKCILLHDYAVELFGTVKIYGTSWNPLIGFPFFRAAGEAIAHEWAKIPWRVDNEGKAISDTQQRGGPIDILVTHTPPLGRLDEDTEDLNKHKGDADLIQFVELYIQPKFHVFGHLHGRNGAAINDKGTTVYINAAVAIREKDENSGLPKIAGAPVVFDFEIPNGKTRKELGLKLTL